MNLVEDREGWRIEGQGSERARVAYASEHDGRLVYSWEPAHAPELSLRGTLRPRLISLSPIYLISMFFMN